MRLEVISRSPASSRKATPLLFVHGMMHAAWCWERHFLDYFARHGYESHAVNLRGHGNSEGRERIRWTRIAEFTDDLAQAVSGLPSPAILVGHSMGGVVIQKYLEDYSAPAAVLLSSPGPTGFVRTVLRVARRRPLAFAKANVTLRLTPLVATPQLAREAFFADDLPDDELLAYWTQMQDDSYRAFLDMVALDLPRAEKIRTPLLVLGVGRDNMIAPAEIEATARAYGTHAEIVPEVAHDSMLDPRWRNVADRILAWLADRPQAGSGTPERDAQGGSEAER